jgi:hypothetical protein
METQPMCRIDVHERGGAKAAVVCPNRHGHEGVAGIFGRLYVAILAASQCAGVLCCRPPIGCKKFVCI